MAKKVNEEICAALRRTIGSRQFLTDFNDIVNQGKVCFNPIRNEGEVNEALADKKIGKPEYGDISAITYQGREKFRYLVDATDYKAYGKKAVKNEDRTFFVITKKEGNGEWKATEMDAEAALEAFGTVPPEPYEPLEEPEMDWLTRIWEGIKDIFGASDIWNAYNRQKEINEACISKQLNDVGFEYIKYNEDLTVKNKAENYLDTGKLEKSKVKAEPVKEQVKENVVVTGNKKKTKSKGKSIQQHDVEEIDELLDCVKDPEKCDYAVSPYYTDVVETIRDIIDSDEPSKERDCLKETLIGYARQYKKKKDAGDTKAMEEIINAWGNFCADISNDSIIKVGINVNAVKNHVCSKLNSNTWLETTGIGRTYMEKKAEYEKDHPTVNNDPQLNQSLNLNDPDQLNNSDNNPQLGDLGN